MSSFTPAQTGFSRVFIQKYGARVDRALVYHSCMRAGAVEQSLGDVTKIECPHPTRANEFIEIAEIVGAEERGSTQLVGRYPATEASALLELAKLACDSDIHINLGVCKDVSQPNTFAKKVILEKSRITNYATDELGTLESEGRAVVNETADVSMKTFYEVLGLTFAARAGDLVTNEVVDVVICDTAQCGSCDEPSDGCQKIFALTLSAGGSPSTPADIVFSRDKGATWLNVDIDTLGAAENPSALACVGDYLVVVSNASNSLHYALLSQFDATPDPDWTEVSTGFVTNAEPNDIWSVGNAAFIVADGGYVYYTSDPTAGVSVLDAGVAVQDDLHAIHAISDTFFVGVGNAGAVVKSENGTIVTAVTPRPVGAAINLTSVWVKENSEDEWFIGTSGGVLLGTVNGGVTYPAVPFNGSGTGVVRDIAFATKSVGYLSHSTAAAVGRLFRTYDGGKTWVLSPDQSLDSLVDNDRLTAIAACAYDANFVVAGGLGANGTDGILLVGSD